MKRLTFGRRLTAALALVLATSALAVLAPAAHADPNPNLVVTGTTLYLVYEEPGAVFPAQMTLDVTAKNGGKDDVDVAIEYFGTVLASGKGTLTELPSFFALDCTLYSLDGRKFHYVGQIYRGSGVGSGKYQEDGTHVWHKWSSLGFNE